MPLTSEFLVYDDMLDETMSTYFNDIQRSTPTVPEHNTSIIRFVMACDHHDYQYLLTHDGPMTRMTQWSSPRKILQTIRPHFWCPICITKLLGGELRRTSDTQGAPLMQDKCHILNAGHRWHVGGI